MRLPARTVRRMPNVRKNRLDSITASGQPTTSMVKVKPAAIGERPSTTRRAAPLQMSPPALHRSLLR
jgi:hypothetical protein